MMERPKLAGPSLGIVAAVLCAACGSGAKPPSDVTGTWTGTLSSGGDPSGVRFDLTEQNSNLTGGVYFQDPETREFVGVAEVTGTRKGADATWTTDTDLLVIGKFEGNGFDGTIQFPLDEFGPLAPHVAKVRIQR